MNKYKIFRAATTRIKQIDTDRLAYVATITLLLLAVFVPQSASAAQITGRKFTLSNSAGAATSVSYTFVSAAVPTSGTALKSVAAQACTTASGSCTTPTGFTSGSSSLSTQPSGLGCTSAWSNSTAVTGSLRITHASCSTSPSGAVSIAWSGVTNPTANNTTFFLRVTTYSDAAWTTAVDSGVVAVSTAQQITVSASADESLTFCTGTSGVTSSSCAGATGSSVSLGTLTASSTGSGTSQVGVTTNAGSGYAITINGSTLTSGSDTITALATQTASSQGSEQFGVNLKANTTPSVGSDPAGAGSGAPSANYGTANQFRFVTGDSIATAGAADAFRLYTVSYIANIAALTEPGTYQATFTYICTATF